MEEANLEFLNSVTEKIVSCAIEVHRTLGPGLLESIYEKALCYELSSHLKITSKKLGLLINFNVPVLKDGIKRMIL